MLVSKADNSIVEESQGVFAAMSTCFDAALLAVLAIAFTPFARRNGEVFALVITLHPISRILLEEIRVDEPPALGTQLSISQLMSVGILCCSMVFWWWLSTQPRRVMKDNAQGT